MAELFSRHSDPTPVRCESCGWTGQVKDCAHGFKGMPVRGEDVEPCDYCPICQSEQLTPMDAKEVIRAHNDLIRSNQQN